MNVVSTFQLMLKLIKEKKKNNGKLEQWAESMSSTLTRPENIAKHFILLVEK